MTLHFGYESDTSVVYDDIAISIGGSCYGAVVRVVYHIHGACATTNTASRI